MNYKTISNISAQFSDPYQLIAIKVELAIDRELTVEEERIARDFVRTFTNTLRENTTLADDKYKADVLVQRTGLLACFPEPIYVKEIPNEYLGNKLEPWYLVTTKKGLIKVGWRNRVIVVDWSESDVQQGARLLFQGEDTTMDGRMIHAWGYEKAKEYIYTILSK